MPDSLSSQGSGDVKPIVDPDGEWLWVPAIVAPDQAAAVAFAKDYWPDKPCYEPWKSERMRVVTAAMIPEDDEDAQWTLEEYGGSGIGFPCGEDEGQAYWPIRCYPEAA